MLHEPNALRWTGSPGHYEVYYLTLTDPETGVGVWIRYTLLAPLERPPSCALWLLTMDPRRESRGRFARKATFPADRLHARSDPFSLELAGAELTDAGMRGGFEDVAWDLRWRSPGRPFEHVHPLVRRAGAASTVLVLPHGGLSIEGTVRTPELQLELTGALGGQAHLWGSRHAERWVWAHCSDFTDLEGSALPGALLDAVSVYVSRGGRTVGPATPVVGRLEDEDFRSTAPVRVLANRSRFALTGWRCEAIAGRRKVVIEVDADRATLAGVTYHDPDGRAAYCYNSEVATMRVQIHHRARLLGGWTHRHALQAGGRAHFEYGDRSPAPGLGLLIS